MLPTPATLRPQKRDPEGKERMKHQFLPFITRVSECQVPTIDLLLPTKWPTATEPAMVVGGRRGGRKPEFENNTEQ